LIIIEQIISQARRGANNTNDRRASMNQRRESLNQAENDDKPTIRKDDSDYFYDDTASSNS